MPTPTPEELREAKKRKAEERRQQEEEELEKYGRRSEWLRRAKAQYAQLNSVAGLLYDEVDKLAKKRPEDPVTKLYVNKTNQLIASVKDLLAEEAADDAFAADLENDLNSIVTAGDLPERQDVLLILRETRAALSRFQSRHQRDWGYSSDI